MARDGSGTMSIPNSFTPSTTISSSAVNANFTDLGTEITNSVAADGRTTLIGALKGADGTAALPSYSFSSDLNTGVYRKAADSLGFATGGSERAYIDSAGKLFALGAADVAGAVNLQSTLAIAGTVSAAGAIEVGHASDTTLARASAGNLTVEGNAIYRAGGTDVAIADGGHGQSTAAAGFAALKQDATTAATGVVQLADQAAQEAATTGRAVTSDVQHLHPSAAKFWAYVTTSGGVPTLAASYNVTSITDSGFGQLTVTIATDFSSANYCCVMNVQDDGSSTGASGIITGSIDQTALAAGVVVLAAWGTGQSGGGGRFDPKSYHVVGYGDQ